MDRVDDIKKRAIRIAGFQMIASTYDGQERLDLLNELVRLNIIAGHVADLLIEGEGA